MDSIFNALVIYLGLRIMTVVDLAVGRQEALHRARVLWVAVKEPKLSYHNGY